MAMTPQQESLLIQVAQDMSSLKALLGEKVRQVDRHDERIARVERWQWVVIGAAGLLSVVANHLPILSPLIKKDL